MRGQSAIFLVEKGEEDEEMEEIQKLWSVEKNKSLQISSSRGPRQSIDTVY